MWTNSRNWKTIQEQCFIFKPIKVIIALLNMRLYFNAIKQIVCRKIPNRVVRRYQRHFLKHYLKHCFWSWRQSRSHFKDLIEQFISQWNLIFFCSQYFYLHFKFRFYCLSEPSSPQGLCDIYIIYRECFLKEVFKIKLKSFSQYGFLKWRKIFF